MQAPVTLYRKNFASNWHKAATSPAYAIGLILMTPKEVKPSKGNLPRIFKLRVVFNTIEHPTATNN